MRNRITIAALLALAASACNNPPAPQSASHPPALDLTCQAEPPALTDTQVLADDASEAAGLGRPNEELFNNQALIAGRDCRDTLGRACHWHVERGDREVDCDKLKVIL
jgi:hypothetical protein